MATGRDQGSREPSEQERERERDKGWLRKRHHKRGKETVSQVNRRGKEKERETSIGRRKATGRG